MDQGGSLRYAPSYQLGLSCAKCHGDGRRHIAYHSSHRTEKPGKFIFNAGRTPRDAKLDDCALAIPEPGSQESRHSPISPAHGR